MAQSHDATHAAIPSAVAHSDAAQHPPADDGSTARRAWHQWLLAWPLGVVICLAVGVLAYHVSLGPYTEARADSAARRLEFFAQSLSAEVERNQSLPALIALDVKLAEVLEAQTPASVDRANRYLEEVATQAGISAAYVMNASGLTIAASNWNKPTSFMQQDYGFRPYFQDAAAGRIGRFYGVGVTTGEPGYFLARKVITPQGPWGVAAVKVSLSAFESALQQSGEAVVVSDVDGVIFLSAVEEWKYRSLSPLSAQTRARLEATRQYGGQPLLPVRDDGAVSDRQSMYLTRGGNEHEYLVTSQPIDLLGWRMTLMTDTSDARHDAWLTGVAAASIAALLVVAGMLWRLVQGRHADRVAAAQALQRLTASLDLQLAARTADIRTAHDELERKVTQLQRAEVILHQTRDSAVQAGKLAVLGQMSAGVSHELNQPLAALQTLSDNAALLLDRQRYDEVRNNLSLIGQLTARMGNILRQLKVFARNERGPLTAVSLASATDHALLIAEPRRREVDAVITVLPEVASFQVIAETVRLEQVLVNLLRNALDAASQRPQPRLVVAAQELPAPSPAAAPLIAIHVRDSGPGIDAQAFAHLFEPFYTTKPVGEGLGLGLALSLSIVESFGGRLEARNLEAGGAEFTIILPRA